MARWYSVSCEECGDEIRVCDDFSHTPRFCRPCKDTWAAGWRQKPCAVCCEALHYRVEWPREPLTHRACWPEIAPKTLACADCGNSFRVGTRYQRRCRENGWALPTRCFECRYDALVIKGAVGALRDQVNFPLETTMEQRGILFTDKVAVVRNRMTGEVIAEVTMEEKGLLSMERGAVTVDRRDGENRETARTREGSHGIFFPERTADTFSSDTKERTHRTRIVERGVFFPERLAKTEHTSGSSQPVRTYDRVTGIIFPKRSLVSGRS